MALEGVFKAMADPTRREILALLRRSPLSAGEIADRFAVSKPTISHHLNQLKQADLVYAERSGTSLVYHLNLTVVEELAAALAGLFKGDRHAPDPSE